jgi:hypothetical protein
MGRLLRATSGGHELRQVIAQLRMRLIRVVHCPVGGSQTGCRNKVGGIVGDVDCVEILSHSSILVNLEERARIWLQNDMNKGQTHMTPKKTDLHTQHLHTMDQ